MAAERPRKVRVTVIRKVDMRTIHPDQDMGAADWLEPVCPAFKVGDEFIVEGGACPEGFCQGAFVDIFRYISGLRAGANYYWMKEEGTVVACCADGLRPVVFKLERLDEPIH